MSIIINSLLNNVFIHIIIVHNANSIIAIKNLEIYL